MRPRDLVHMGSLCVPSSCSSGLSCRTMSDLETAALRESAAGEDAVAGWFASKLERDHNAYTPPRLIELPSRNGAEIPEPHPDVVRVLFNLN